MITDSDLNLIAEGPTLIVHQPEEALAGMDEWVTGQHGASGLTQKVRDSSISVQQAEQQTLEFIKQYCNPQTSPLCGNSIWVDRMFLHNYMPHITAYMHYRIIDVSTIKELVKRWYPQDPNNEFVKQDTHRALADIQESVAELKHFRKHFFKLYS